MVHQKFQPVDDLLGKSHMTGLYVQACTLPYTLTGSNIQDVQNIQDSKPICYVDEHWLESYFFTDEVVEYLDGKVPHNIERAYINMGIHSETPRVHTDSGSKGDKTLLYYINEEWKNDWGGETIFMSPNCKDVEYITPFVPGRIIVFDSITPHAARQQSFAGPKYRFTLAIKFRA